MIDLSSFEYNSEYPTLFSFCLTIAVAFVLGSLLAFTYERTSREISRPIHFLQSIVLITIVSATIIQAIGDSVARGLGMIGTLSIIRFRSSIKDTRNLTFMFAAIAIGVSCGVLGFLIGTIGTIGFSITAFILRYSSFSRRDLITRIKLEQIESPINTTAVDTVLRSLCDKSRLVKRQANLNADQIMIYNYWYELRLKRKVPLQQLFIDLNNTEGVKVLKTEQEQDNYNNI